MADPSQTASLASDNGAQDMSVQDTDAQGNAGQVTTSVNGDESGAPASSSEVVWLLGEISPPDHISSLDTAGVQQFGDGADLVLAATVAPEAPANLDHALDQLTTVTDLFDVPVLDFHNS
jgi:hypothetical protein